jgi:hypothetical protein
MFSTQLAPTTLNKMNKTNESRAAHVCLIMFKQSRIFRGDENEIKKESASEFSAKIAHKMREN